MRPQLIYKRRLRSTEYLGLTIRCDDATVYTEITGSRSTFSTAEEWPQLGLIFIGKEALLHLPYSSAAGFYWWAGFFILCLSVELGSFWNVSAAKLLPSSSSSWWSSLDFLFYSRFFKLNVPVLFVLLLLTLLCGRAVIERHWTALTDDVAADHDDAAEDCTETFVLINDFDGVSIRFNAPSSWSWNLASFGLD